MRELLLILLGLLVVLLAWAARRVRRDGGDLVDEPAGWDSPVEALSTPVPGEAGPPDDVDVPVGPPVGRATVAYPADYRPRHGLPGDQIDDAGPFTQVGDVDPARPTVAGINPWFAAYVASRTAGGVR